MQTTIDRAGRLVIPKPLRDRLGIAAGGDVEVTEHDGVIEVRPVAVEARVVDTTSGPVVEATGPVPPLTDRLVQATIDDVRR